MQSILLGLFPASAYKATVYTYHFQEIEIEKKQLQHTPHTSLAA
jgi:hypothetical protein